MIYLDTNIFIRALTGDDEEKKQACQKVFLDLITGHIKAKTTESVLTEIVYVLQSKRLGYKLDRKEIYMRLLPIFEIQNLIIPNKDILLYALFLFSQNTIDIEDAILAAYTIDEGQNTELYSYDTDFDSLPKLQRREP